MISLIIILDVFDKLDWHNVWSVERAGWRASIRWKKGDEEEELDQQRASRALYYLIHSDDQQSLDYWRNSHEREVKMCWFSVRIEIVSSKHKALLTLLDPNVWTWTSPSSPSEQQIPDLRISCIRDTAKKLLTMTSIGLLGDVQSKERQQSIVVLLSPGNTKKHSDRIIELQRAIRSKLRAIKDLVIDVWWDEGKI